ncbi:MAG TPA: TonB family protein [Candidatus Dormibacteraeota bacterium]|nr:TonB family protein [Candidatus Dormibacteraeota bacterium]
MVNSLNPYRILPLPPAIQAKPRQLAAHWRTPLLAVPWNSFGHSFLGSLHALFSGPPAPQQFLGGNYFRDCWIDRGIPKQALALAAAIHVIFFLLPYPQMPGPRRVALTQNDVQLTWSMPARDLPSVVLPSRAPGPPSDRAPQTQSKAPLPSKGAEGYHPRQTIFTDSLHPTHPRQTLVNSAAQPEPPKILPSLPNIVQLAQATQPARPRLVINRDELAKLRPTPQATRRAEDVPLPQVPNDEKQVGDFNLAAHSPAIAKPAMPLNASAAPRIGPRAAAGESGPPPDLQPAAPNSAASQTFIALSATPAPPQPQLPLVHGNLSARLAISPDGAKPGTPGGTLNSHAPGGNGAALGGPNTFGGGNRTGGEGNNKTGVSISGGNPNATSQVSGLRDAHPFDIAGAAGNAAPRPLPDRPTPSAATADATRTSPAPNVSALPPGAKPETILGPKKIYTLNVNMPNLSSAMGSWVLSFTELRDDVASRRSSPGSLLVPASDLIGPVPLRKVDPKYPPALIQEKIEGEVVLYAVIRRDGSVDSIQLVSGLDDQLDTNAMQALSRWKFRPGERAGAPVALEAIVHIPFRIARSRF